MRNSFEPVVDCCPGVLLIKPPEGDFCILNTKIKHRNLHV